MVDPSHTVEPARDLLGDVPARQRRKRVLRRQAPSELVSARALCAQLRRNPPDHTGRTSVSIPWTRLEFPQV